MNTPVSRLPPTPRPPPRPPQPAHLTRQLQEDHVDPAPPAAERRVHHHGLERAVGEVEPGVEDRDAARVRVARRGLACRRGRRRGGLDAGVDELDLVLHFERVNVLTRDRERVGVDVDREDRAAGVAATGERASQRGVSARSDGGEDKAGDGQSLTLLPSSLKHKTRLRSRSRGRGCPFRRCRQRRTRPCRSSAPRGAPR